jgi:hypothetical protein
MVASLRDVWRMARGRSFDGSYRDAYRLLVESGRYYLTAGIDEPIMVRPAIAPAIPLILQSDLGPRLEMSRLDFGHG